MPGDPVNTSRLLRLLRSNDAEEVAAAALVLARLRVPASRALKPVLRALDAAPTVTVPYILDSLASLGGAGVTRAMLPLLTRDGAVREQATELLAQRKGVVPLLLSAARRKDADSGALIQVLERVGTPTARKALFQLLPRADFVCARRVYGAVARISESGPLRLRGELSRLALATFARTRRAPTGRIAILKILGVLRPAAAARTLADALDDREPAVRRAAIELAGLLRWPRRNASLAKALLTILDDASASTMHAGVVTALANSVDACVLLPRIEGLLDAHHSLATALLTEFPALHERCSGSPEEQQVLGRALAAALHHRDRRVAAAASRLIAQHPQLLPLAVAMGCERATLDTALREHASGPSSARFEWLMQQPATPDQLLGLAAADRARTNAFALEQARSRLAANDAAGATEWLEPLVRGRQATPEVRLLLAAAWIQRIPSERPLALPRALQLIGPLLRVDGFDVAAALRVGPALDSDAVLELATQLAARGRPERALAALLSMTTPERQPPAAG